MADLHHWLGHIRTGRDIDRARDKFAGLVLGLSVDGGTGLHNAPVPGGENPEGAVGTGPPEAPVHYPCRLELPVSKNWSVLSLRM
jgi:hypothetical protein